jgi:hypothetical protein
MSVEIKNDYASSNLLTYVATISNYTIMHNFEEKYASMIAEYSNKPEFSFLSSIDVSGLDSFKNWSGEALIMKHITYPLLVSKLLRGDIFALDIYNNLHKLDEKTELVIDYRRIHSDSLLKAKFNHNGAAEDARAILTAEYWLGSQEAFEIMKQNSEGVDNLCIITGMLHINNAYINC